jgi:spore photoproduct lyase
MFSAIYYENDVKGFPLTESVLQRFVDIPQIPIQRYGEIFNRKSQNFRLQKIKPALILARKHDRCLHRRATVLVMEKVITFHTC